MQYLVYKLAGQARLLQTITSKKEKTMVAMIILSSSSYIGKEMRQIFVSSFLLNLQIYIQYISNWHFIELVVCLQSNL